MGDRPRRQRANTSAWVYPGAVAERLDKSPASVTEMLQRLDDRELVCYEPYNGNPVNQYVDDDS